MDVYVERLYAALTDAMRRGRPRAFEAPVTVAEIYQDLVPYRMVRAPLGFELNADYEHALLQLLAGAGGLARLEPPEAAAELREEARSPNPNVGLFRKFAACDVWIAAPADSGPEVEEEGFAPEPVEDEAAGAEAAPATAEGTSAATQASTWQDVASPAAARPAQEADAAEAAPAAQPAGTLEAASRAEAASGVQEADAGSATAGPVRDAARRCGFCDARLPAGRLVRFCPHCGADQTRLPCVACGESLEAAWRFCVACGAPQEGRTSA